MKNMAVVLWCAVLASAIGFSDAGAQRIETYLLKGYPIGQPRVNLLPKESKTVRILTDTTIALSGITDSTQIGMYTGTQDDSIKTHSTTIQIWKSAWIPVYGAKQVVITLTHAGTDSGYAIVSGYTDTVNVTPSAQDGSSLGDVSYITTGNPTNQPHVGFHVLAATTTPLTGNFTRTSTQNTSVITLLPPYRLAGVEIDKYLTARYVRILVRPAKIPTAGADAIYGGVGRVRIKADVFYDGAIPGDWIYDTYKGAVAQ